MITEAFDPLTPSITYSETEATKIPVDACIVTFSHVILSDVLKAFRCEQIATLFASTGETPIYLMEYKGKRIAVYLTYLGAPAAGALLEDAFQALDTDRFVVFGGSGCLNKEIARGKVMVPNAAYRDEGTSYHYAPASDYIEIPHCKEVAAFMEEAGIPYVLGKTWTTDAIYRETRGNFEKRKAEGCISVEMECSALQAVSTFRGKNLFYFLTSGDLLDSPKWDSRRKEGQIAHTQHDVGHFEIALELAVYVSGLS